VTFVLEEPLPETKCIIFQCCTYDVESPTDL